MSLLIPRVRADPGMLGRFGRLIYWAALMLVALCFACFVIQEMPPQTAPASPVASSAPTANIFDQFDPPKAMLGRTALGGYLLPPSQPIASAGVPGPIFLVLAGIIFLIGRGARYLFAGE